jgi:DNA-binding MarR family transcriptional regulator
MLETHVRVLTALDHALQQVHRLPVREFDVLITLFNAPGWSLRMSDLAARVMLSPSGLTRLVDRLQREGLVIRETDSADARSYRAILTNEGLRRLDEARPTHNRVIRELFLDHLEPKQHEALGAIWRTLCRAATVMDNT